MSVFMLPHGCIKKTESHCSRFLCYGSIDSPKVFKIPFVYSVSSQDWRGSWSKKIHSLEQGSFVSSLYGFYSLIVNLCGLLGRDIIIYRKKAFGNCLNQIKIPDAQRFVKAILGDGCKISFWFDAWTPYWIKDIELKNEKLKGTRETLELKERRVTCLNNNMKLCAVTIFIW